MSAPIIVTPNGNVAFHLHNCERNIEYHQGEKIWIPRAVYVYEDWLNGLIEPLLELKRYSGFKVLTSLQEQAVWSTIINEWNPKRDRFDIYDTRIPLLSFDSTVKQAMSCWKTLRRYHALETSYLPNFDTLKLGNKLWERPQGNIGDYDVSDYEVSEYCLRQLNGVGATFATDARCSSEEFGEFVKWQKQFQEICKKNKWIDAAVLPSLVAANLGDKEYVDKLRSLGKLPDEIVAYGFLEAPDTLEGEDVRTSTFTPQRTVLFQALQSLGVKVTLAADLDSTNMYKGLKPLNCEFHCQIADKPKDKKNTDDTDSNNNSSASATLPEGEKYSQHLHQSVYTTTTQEYYAVAKQVLQAVTTDNDGKGFTNVGVIIPDLEEHRAEIIQAFDETLCPQCLLPEHCQEERPYTISLGQSLDQVPIVRDALLLFQFTVEELPLTAVTDLVFSPYFINIEYNLQTNAQFDVKLRKTKRPALTLKQLLSTKHQVRKNHKNEVENISEIIPKNFRERLTHLQNCIDEFYRVDNPRGTTKGYADWSGFFRQALSDMKWSQLNYRKETNEEGESSTVLDLSYDELKARNKFLTLLEKMASLDSVINVKITYAEAVRTLKKLAQDTIFQSRAGYKAPVHISGILEAVGLRFDRIFVMGYTDQSWPSLSMPQSYLPIDLQKTLHITSKEAELRQADWVNARLKSLAERGTISFANTHVVDKTVQELSLSHLWHEIENHITFDFVSAETKKKMDGEPITLCDRLIQDSFTETATDHKLVNNNLEQHANARPPQVKVLYCSSGLITDQLNCPFKALVKKRWGVDDELGTEDYCTDPMTMGNIVHYSMEALWKKWGDAAKNTPEATSVYVKHLVEDWQRDPQLEKDIREAVHNSIETYRKELLPHYGETFYELEKERYCELILRWFTELEIAHSDLGQYDVKSEENAKLSDQQMMLKLQQSSENANDGVTVSLRLDRLDCFKNEKGIDSGIYIGDYKTGTSYYPYKWFSSAQMPPADMQLPLYALAANSAISKTEPQLELKGLGYDKLVAKPGKEDNSEYIALIAKGKDGQAETRTYNPKKPVKKKQKPESKENPEESPEENGDSSLTYTTENCGDFGSILQDWQNWADLAAEGLLQGRHPIIPSEEGCKYCKFASLCRKDYSDSEQSDT